MAFCAVVFVMGSVAKHVTMTRVVGSAARHVTMTRDLLAGSCILKYKKVTFSINDILMRPFFGICLIINCEQTFPNCCFH